MAGREGNTALARAVSGDPLVLRLIDEIVPASCRGSLGTRPKADSRIGILPNLGLCKGTVASRLQRTTTLGIVNGKE